MGDDVFRVHRDFAAAAGGIDDELRDGVASGVPAKALDDLNASRAAVLFDEADDYSRGIATVFRASFSRRGEVVAFESYVTGDSDFNEQMLRIREANPDVLYLPAFHKQAVMQAELAKKLGVDTILLGSDGWDQRKVPLLKAFNNSYFSLHWDSRLQSREKELFSTRYFESFKQEPNGTAALTYDAVQLLLIAMNQQQKTTTAAIRQGLLQLGPYPGVGGLIDFVDSGDPQKPVLVMHVKDGTRRFFKVVEP